MKIPLIQEINKKEMPDISFETQPMVEGKLHAVGMRSIEMPILLEPQKGKSFYQKAKINAFVSLDQRKAKGIHMSRLYLVLQEELEKNIFSINLMKKILRRFLKSQRGLSHSSQIRIQLDWPILRKSLKSPNVSWKYYPVLFEVKHNHPLKKKKEAAEEKIQFQVSHSSSNKNSHLFSKNQNEDFEFTFGAKIYYSSTCPCSEALSRSVTQNAFLKDFKDQKFIPSRTVLNWLKQPPLATPHAQRSLLKFKIKMDSDQGSFNPVPFIDEIEKHLGTPVQTLVKREDEQEFARLNAQNLMFCEDAARKVKGVLDRKKDIKDYMIFVEHFESLHPHTATSFVFKGVKDGFNHYYW